MSLSAPPYPTRTAPLAARASIGRVVSVTGAQATVGLVARADGDGRVTVGTIVGIESHGTLAVGTITEITEQSPTQARESGHAALAALDLVGEIRHAGLPSARFMRGISDYPSIADPAVQVSDAEMALLYESRGDDAIRIGNLHQGGGAATVNVDEMLSKHFGVLGTTGVGKSNGVVVILRQILEARPDLRVFLLDPHNEYARCFGERAMVMTPRNLRLPFWLFNFEEIADVFFGGRPGVEEEMQALSEAIPFAKSAYTQYRGNAASGALAKRKEPRSAGYTADTPVPYRIEDLITILDEQMGKLENRTSRMTFHKLITRIQTVRNDPRYAFMFENANIGGDTMAEVLSHLFRLPPNGKPMAIMQLAGLPAEVVDSVVSVVCRMAFDFGLWSDGAAPMLLVCEEAHRYAPADRKIGFGPTRRALSRLAKEGRKYGVFLGLITQRPAEIDPTILSQCSTLFVMRMANDRDQALVRSAVSDAAASLLTFIPSLGTREVFAFGCGVTVPTRLTFSELPPEVRPQSESGGNTRAASDGMTRELIGSVIDRWRAATMSQKSTDDGFAEASLAPEPPPYQPPPPPAPAAALAPATSRPAGVYQPPPGRVAPTLDPQRFRLLRRDTDVAADPARAPAGGYAPPPPSPTKWR